VEFWACIVELAAVELVGEVELVGGAGAVELSGTVVVELLVACKLIAIANNATTVRTIILDRIDNPSSG